MKRIILLSAVIVFALQSCKKEDPEYCWKCVTKKMQYGIPEYTDSTIQCGLTDKAAREYEDLHYSKTGDKPSDIEISVHCKIQD